MISCPFSIKALTTLFESGSSVIAPLSSMDCWGILAFASDTSNSEPPIETTNPEFFACSSIKISIPEVPWQLPETFTRISPGREIFVKSIIPVELPLFASIMLSNCKEAPGMLIVSSKVTCKSSITIGLPIGMTILFSIVNSRDPWEKLADAKSSKLKDLKIGKISKAGIATMAPFGTSSTSG